MRRQNCVLSPRAATSCWVVAPLSDLIAAGFASAGLPLSAGILLAVPAAGASAALLCRYYDRVPPPAPSG